jgi:hypothetical protein
VKLKHKPFVFLYEGTPHYDVVEMNDEEKGVFRVTLSDAEFEIQLCHIEASYRGQADGGELNHDFLQAVGDGLEAAGIY